MEDASSGQRPLPVGHVGTRDTRRLTATAIFTLPALRRARDLMDLGYAEPLDLERLASEAGYSKYHFVRAFRSAYGETPVAYLTRRRVERAKSLLRNANLSVTEICFLVGFQSLGSFSALFKRLVGQTPSAYRSAVFHAGHSAPIPGCVLLMWTRPHPHVAQPRRSDGAGPRRTVRPSQPKEDV